MREAATLLDASLLIALTIGDHVHHEPAERWSIAHAGPIATCPITQGSLVRFLVRGGASGEEARRFLVDVIDDDRHRFWPADRAFEAVDLGSVVGHRQVTDAYRARATLRTLPSRTKRNGAVIARSKGFVWASSMLRG